MFGVIDAFSKLVRDLHVGVDAFDADVSVLNVVAEEVVLYRVVSASRRELRTVGEMKSSVIVLEDG